MKGTIVVDQTKATIRAFLAPHFRNLTLLDDQDLFASGFVNSLFAMQLVLFVEREFGISVENEDLLIENFSSIDAMANLIQRKIGVLA
jgi:methoxymalonate biosynthesis acyl carrier protein